MDDGGKKGNVTSDLFSSCLSSQLFLSLFFVFFFLIFSIPTFSQRALGGTSDCIHFTIPPSITRFALFSSFFFHIY